MSLYWDITKNGGHKKAITRFNSLLTKRLSHLYIYKFKSEEFLGVSNVILLLWWSVITRRCHTGCKECSAFTRYSVSSCSTISLGTARFTGIGLPSMALDWQMVRGLGAVCSHLLHYPSYLLLDLHVLLCLQILLSSPVQLIGTALPSTDVDPPTGASRFTRTLGR